jgi:hypothetical protein
MDSIDLIRENLRRSQELVLQRVEEMRPHATVFPTLNGGAHTLWVLGHLAFIESLVVHRFMRGEANPLAHWEASFDGPDVSGDVDAFPPFDDVLTTCRAVRAQTLAFADMLTEADIDRPSAVVPAGWEATFGTYRLCLQYTADHWYMHRGQLADARRAAGLARMGV